MKAIATKIAALFAIALLLGGCASTNPELQTYVNNNNGETTDLLTDNLLSINAAPGTDLWLNTSRIVKRNGTSIYHLEVHFESLAGALEIPPGESLKLEIDGTAYRYSGLGSSDNRKTNRAGLNVESAAYRTTAEDIKRIASANSVIVTVQGDKGEVKRAFGPDNFDKFKKFVNSYLGGL